MTFADVLAQAYKAKRLNPALAAHWTGLSVDELVAYANGQAEPSFGEGQRILRRLGVAVEPIPVVPMTVGVEGDAIEPLRALGPDRDRACMSAIVQRMGIILDDLSVLEGIKASDEAIMLLADRTTSNGGSPFALARAKDVIGSFDRIWYGAKKGVAPTLAITTPSGLVTSPSDPDPISNAFGFLVNALFSGGDETIARHLFNGVLIAAGYPWLRAGVNPDAYRKAVAILRNTGSGTPLVQVLISTAKESGVYV